MKSKAFEIVFSLSLLVFLGWAVEPLENRASATGVAESEFGAAEASLDSFGSGLSFAILGGYRALLANLIWLSLNADWEAKDYRATMAKIRLATAIDPRPVGFWLNGARIIANDMPVWRVGEWQSDQLRKTAEGRQLQRYFANLALEYLEDATAMHPREPLLEVEKGLIEWTKKGDLAAAADSFGEAAAMPSAPYYVDRVYAELLSKLGRNDLALRHSKSIVDELPEGDPLAMKSVVEERIRRLRETAE